MIVPLSELPLPQIPHIAMVHCTFLTAAAAAGLLAGAAADYVQLKATKVKGSWPQNADVDKYPIYAYYSRIANASGAAVNGTVAAGVYNDRVYYAVDLALGSDAQNVTVLVDTVSSDLWVNSVDNAVCAAGVESPSNFTIDYSYTVSGASASSSALSSSALSSSSPSAAPLSTYYTTSYNSASDVFYVDGYVSTVTTTTATEQTSAVTTRSYDIQFYPSAAVASYSQWLSAYPYPTNAINSLVVLEAEPHNCSAWGLFDSSSSESFVTNNDTFESIAEDGTTVSGIWAQDYVAYGDALVSNVSFGLVSDSESDSFGVLGLGLPSAESTWLAENTTYDNFLAKLKAQGAIHKQVYAIYDNYLSGNSSLLFGGIDHEAYVGNLTILPLVEVPIAYNDSRNASAIAITLSAVYLDDESNGANDTSLIASGLGAAIIDTSLATASFPYYLYDEIVAAAGFVYSENLKAFIANASDIANKTLGLDFQDFEVDVPIADLSFPLVDIANNKTSDYVVFGAEATANDTIIIGDAVLQYLYFAVDLEDLEIVVAHKNFFPTSQEIVAITSTFPHATSAASYNQTYGYHGVTDLKLATVENPNSISQTSFSGSFLPSITLYQTTVRPTTAAEATSSPEVISAAAKVAKASKTSKTKTSKTKTTSTTKK